MRQVYPGITTPPRETAFDREDRRMLNFNQSLPRSRAEANGEPLWPAHQKPRERWHFVGTGIVQGQRCYLWKRNVKILPEIDPDERYPEFPRPAFQTQAYAHPVDTFWPRQEVGEIPSCDTYLSGCPKVRQERCVAADRCTGEDEVMG